MLPIIDDAILQNNPKFAALHRTLTGSILNADGSTRVHPVQAERNGRAEALQSHRIVAAKHAFLRTALSSLPLPDPAAASSTKTSTAPTTNASKTNLPPDLIELIILLTLNLAARPNALPPAHHALESTILHDLLPPHLPQLCALISSHLHKQALPLARMLSPSTNSSYLHRQIPKTPQHLQTLQSKLSTQKVDLQTRRLALSPLTTQILSRYRQATVLCIQILEQTVHGQIARSAKLHSEMLALEARAKEAEASILLPRVRDAVYTPEVKGALKVYGEHLRDGRARLVQREKEARRELRGYGVGREENGGGDAANKEKVMREVARVYGEMMKEVEEVRRDLQRLTGK